MARRRPSLTDGGFVYLGSDAWDVVDVDEAAGIVTIKRAGEQATVPMDEFRDGYLDWNTAVEVYSGKWRS